MNMNLTKRQGALMVAAVAAAVYVLSLFNMFAYDDVAVIPLDKRIHSLSILRDIFTISYWNNEAQALYRPLVTGSFAVDWAIASNHPGWYHFTNLLWNAAACALAFLLLAELFPVAAALAGAMLFAVHPVHVEAVANIVGRAELMAATFVFAAALVWMRAHSRVALYAGVPVLFALALFSKESAIMLPPLLVLFDVASGRFDTRAIPRWLRERAGVIAVLALTAVGFLLLRASVIPTLVPQNLDAALEVAPHGMPRILTALQAWPVYLRLFVFPVTLLADYGPRILLPQSSFTPMVLAGAGILAACVVGGLVAAVRGHGRIALALLWVPVALLPVSNLLFPIGILVAERLLYLPSFAIAVGVAAAFAYTPERYARHAVAAVFLIAVACTTRTLIRIPEWKNTQTVFRTLARDRPDSFRAHWHFARKSAQANRPVEAMQSYATALQLWPNRKRLVKEASAYAVENGNLEFGRRINEHGDRLYPQDVDFKRSLAGIAIDVGDSATAAQYVRNGLAISPDDRVLMQMSATLRTWMQQR